MRLSQEMLCKVQARDILMLGGQGTRVTMGEPSRVEGEF